MAVCPNNKRTKEALWPIIEENIAKDTMIFSDGLQSHKKLNEIGYTHMWINHKNTMLTPMTVHFIQIRSRYFGTELQNVKNRKILKSIFFSVKLIVF